MRRKTYLLILAVVLLQAPAVLLGQQTSAKKYPSLFWEISGNGLTKPSYLFGTMHVSSKMVFHLSDSFYYAIKNVDAVALELNPDLWQGQMVNLDRLKQNYVDFIQAPTGDFLTENSFRIKKFDAELKAALSTEPTAVNSLLYRSYKAREDFEEDTFLDLYIFQTGKKLGKRSAGVEDYYETEKVVLEAYADMAREKKKRNIDTQGESFRDIAQKIQEAYRRGDLDLMDSLDLMTERSEAFREKFLYKRNEIQALSIDTILKKNSLFVGVGAAHLAGPRGIIELLRKMGYHLRPITMANRDAVKKEETDQLRVPVIFSTIQSDDGFYSVSMPGPLFKMKDEYQGLDRRQYSDMSNGAYYLVTRVKTYASFVGMTEDIVMNKIDSLLYENIPGKILSKKIIQNSGFKGYDISNRTRRGDLQRYNIFITPYEVLLFKMSGKDNYVDGSEASRFFSSIRFNELVKSTKSFSPAQGGFVVNFPEPPNEKLNAGISDGMDRWEYESTDPTTGDAYLIFKKSVYNFKFLGEDSFDLSLVGESFRSPDFFEKQLYKKYGTWHGYPSLDVKELMKDGSLVTARFIIRGPHYYAIAVRSKNYQHNFSRFFNSFRFTPYQYSTINQYVDTFLRFSVSTPVSPDLDESYRAKLEKVTAEIASSNSYSNYNSYWPKSKNALFKSDSTGETIGVSIQQYPEYYTVKDSSSFWANELLDYYDEHDLVLCEKDSFTRENGVQGYRFTLRDTGSSRVINRLIMLKDNCMYSMVTIGASIEPSGDFVSRFYSSFTPAHPGSGKNIFDDNLDDFFKDLFSPDSTRQDRARQIISNIYYGEKGAPKIIKAIGLLPPGKNYLDSKVKLISELGYIRDSTHNTIVPYLEKIYEQTTDTSLFQNEIIRALARHKSVEAIKLFKKLILQDPPLFDNSYDYSGMFSNLADSLPLAATLYPDLLQLAGIEDYKRPVISLLVTLVDSALVQETPLEAYYSQLYFDARIEQKKQQGKDERKTGEPDSDDDDEVEVVDNFSKSELSERLNEYGILLMPFYDKKPAVPKYFEKLLASKDEPVRLNALTLLLKHNKPVPDSIIDWFAARDQWRATLYKRLEKINRISRFPGRYKTQQYIARSQMFSEKNYGDIDSVSLLSKSRVTYLHKNGWVYFFKYRIKKGDDWKIGISGLQPLKLMEVSSDDRLAVLTDKKLQKSIPLEPQLQEQLKKILFTFHKSGKNFFDADDTGYRFTKTVGMEE